MSRYHSYNDTDTAYSRSSRIYRMPTGSSRDLRRRSASGREYETPYQYGTAAAAPQVLTQPHRQSRSGNNRRRANASYRSQAARPSFSTVIYVTVMVIAVAIMAFSLLSYIGLQSDVTSTMTEVASMQTELKNLKENNDETLKAINNSYTNEQIRYKAVTELGMTYPEEGQVETYSESESDYVQQTQEVDP